MAAFHRQLGDLKSKHGALPLDQWPATDRAAAESLLTTIDGLSPRAQGPVVSPPPHRIHKNSNPTPENEQAYLAELAKHKGAMTDSARQELGKLKKKLFAVKEVP
ncbi:MAG: hypothetical protein IT371_25640 [Deltaproteobacteria bacterium]|nr:hypothetical protein [Deltaproteobacteria bacterium]